MTIRPRIEELQDSPILEVWRSGIGVPGVIGLWAGEPDVPTPDFICDAAMAALKAGKTFYTHNRGIPELRSALADYLERLYGNRVSDSRIAITSSGMNSVVLTAQAIAEPGDNCVVIAPSWPNIMRAFEVHGCSIRAVALDHSNDGWRLDMQKVFDACDSRTRAIYYASPGNPTGWMLERDQAEELLAFARRTGIHLIADEVYHRLVYDRPLAPSILEIARADDPLFLVNSFSKSWAMTGWRMGWLIFPEGSAGSMEKLIQFNTSGGQEFLQHGAIAALRDGEPFVKSFVERCCQGRDIVNARLLAMKGVSIVPNAASFYTMFAVEGVSDTMDFCKRALKEALVGLAPGTAFGGGAEGHIRLCYAKSPENLHEAMDRLERFIGSLRQ